MALTERYRRIPAKKQSGGSGSVKPNMVHLDTAAGLAGLIKVALVLRHGEIPPSINYATPNPEIDFESSAFHVVDGMSEWRSGDAPRRAALSSFGIGGTNAHAILEEYRPIARTSATVQQPELPPGDQLIVLSARTDAQLTACAARLLQHVRSVHHEKLRLQDIAFTLQCGRKAMSWRVAFVAGEIAELADRSEEHTSELQSLMRNSNA